jgi:hypothetical protein
MSSWTATNRQPIATTKDLDKVEVAGDARSLGKKGRAQLEAAKEAAGKLVSLLDQGEKANVSLSGYASGKDDPEPDQVQVVVAKAE